MDYDRYYKEAEEILKHHRTGDNSPEWQEKTRKAFLAATTFSPKDLLQIGRWYSEKNQSLTQGETAILLMLFAGMRLQKAVNLKFGDFSDRKTTEEAVPMLNGIPFPDFMFSYFAIKGREEGKDKYVIGEGDVSADTEAVSNEVWELLNRIGICRDELFTALAVKLLTEQEESGEDAIKEDDLVEYLFRRTFATYCAACGLGSKEVLYMLGEEVEGEVAIDRKALTRAYELMSAGCRFENFLPGYDE